MRLILIRHGESEANKKGIHQGQTVDTSLSAEGKIQAKLIAKKLKNYDIEAIYSSDLKRAAESAKELSNITGIKVILDKRLREFNMGDFDDDPETREEKFKEFYAKELAKGKSKYEIRPPNGENYWDFISRVRSFLTDIKKHNKTVLVYSHGGAMEVAINLILGRDKEKDDFKRYWHNNTAFIEAEYTKGKWQLIDINNSEHLKLVKPKKELYDNQNKLYIELKNQLIDKIPKFVKEAYLFGSLTVNKFGTYVQPFGRHKGSNFDVLAVMDTHNIPLKWVYIGKDDLWTIYGVDRIKINGNRHRIDFFIVEKSNIKKALVKLSNLGWKPEKIK